FWQYLYPGGHFRRWWESRYKWWKEHTDPEEITQRFLDDFVPALESLPDAQILKCADLLEDFGYLPQCLDEEDVKALLSGLSKRHWRIDQVVESVVNLIVAAEKPAYLEQLIVYLYGTYDHASRALLGEAMRALGTLSTCLKDDRWFVRSIAAETCSDAQESFVPLLIPLLNDSEHEVRYSAIRALAAHDTEASIEALRLVMGGPDVMAKVVLLRALEEEGAPWGFEFFDEALDSVEEEMWPLGLAGLGTIPTPESAGRIQDFIMNKGFSYEGSRIGFRSLVRMGGDTGRAALLELQAACDDPETAHEIVFALAELGETRIFTKLQDCMFEKDLRDRAMDAMAFLVVADFGNELWKYRELWEKYPGESQAFFLRESLGLQRMNPGDVPNYEGIACSELVAALSHEKWPVRMAALRILQEGAGRSFGSLTKDASSDELRTLARAWNAWLQAR
ncbi:MAG: HEAT repeat domain-containing protein, partial [Planctomycetota bacterium]